MELECEFKFKSATSLYTCVIKSATITKQKTSITGIKGIHSGGRRNCDVEAIRFENQIVRYFPRELHKIFSGLIYFEISNCELKEVSRNDLMGLEYLVELNLTGNHLTTLPNNLFANMPKLQKIFLGDNKLERLSSQLLEPLLQNELTFVGLENNRKINLFYDSWGDLESVESVEKLMKTIDERFGVSNEILENLTLRKFKEMWDTGRLSDFVIKVGLKEFRVHKMALGMHSPVFAAMFENNMEESRNGFMKIVDFRAEVVQEFLDYIYAGQIPNDDTNAIELIAIAAKYDVPELKLACEDKVLRNLNESNSYEILVLGNLYASHDLKEFAFHEVKKKFIMSLPDELMNQPERLKDMLDATQEYNEKIRSFVESSKDQADRDKKKNNSKTT